MTSFVIVLGFIARSDLSPCPVTVIEKFIKMGRHDSNSRLFHRILKEPMS